MAKLIFTITIFIIILSIPILAIDLMQKDYSKMNIQQLMDELIMITSENDPSVIQSVIDTYLSIRKNYS
ncbi:hypothetical protein DERF_008542 [Dermatophagoides farinae]|uniref:Uncharacterized protein n=1 Tax=Dermatophagoides farinae TaxID=6954 RepID=A0A922I0K8_DERFA|nr:hypothetical protein DERF_008542 [Dermatophagoides farinae]